MIPRPSRLTVRHTVKRGASARRVSRGGCTTKIHALADRKGRPIAFLLTGGNVYDGVIAEPLIRKLPPPQKLLADKAYDIAPLRVFLKKRGTVLVIPNKCNRPQPFPFRKKIYKHRNKIERMFCRLKDARRIATRYDKLASNFLSSICLMASIYFWLN